MLKPLLISVSLSASIFVGSVIIDDIKPDVEYTTAYTSLENVLKNALFLSDLGTENAIFLSYSELVKEIPNLTYNFATDKLTYQIDNVCLVGELVNNKYEISDCNL